MGRWMARNVLLLVAAAGIPVLLRAQAPQPSDQKAPTFEVASVKPNTSGVNAGRLGGPASKFAAVNWTVRGLIEWAYQAQSFQIDGGPSWINSDHFDIATTAADSGSSQPRPGGPPSTTQLRMRTLLAERFKLAVHRQAKDMPIYALVTARSDGTLGPELRPSTEDCVAIFAAARRGVRPPSLSATGKPTCDASISPGTVTAGTQPIPLLASVLSRIVQRIVVDRTNLKGNYDLTIVFAPDQSLQGSADTPVADSNAPSIFTALEEQLGLKLEPTRGPVDVLVIDHVEKPTED
jgi:uncharacterized protein (TIGR03435 family)